MNDEGKLPQSIAGAAVSWISVFVAWAESHAAFIASGVAVVASVYSIWASRETIKLRKKEQQKYDNQS